MLVFLKLILLRSRNVTQVLKFVDTIYIFQYPSCVAVLNVMNTRGIFVVQIHNIYPLTIIYIIKIYSLLWCKNEVLVKCINGN